MAAKTDASGTASQAATPEKQKSGGGMLPVLTILVLIPAISWSMSQYVIIPQIRAIIAKESLAGSSQQSVEGHAEMGSSDHSKTAGHGAQSSYEFGPIIVNLSGGLGTRYLRTDFNLTSSDPNLEQLVAQRSHELRDVALTVLGSQTLEDLDAPGAKNNIRNELIAQFNRALRGEVIEQLYFSEFVVQ